MTSPGARIDADHPLVAALEASHEEVFGSPPERDVTRWFSDASVLTRYGIATVNYGTSTGLLDTEDGENLDIDGLVKTAEVYARAAQTGVRMKLVTFDDGKVGRIEGDEVVELAVGSTCASTSSAAAPTTTGPRHALADVRLRAPIVPRKFFHTAGNFREHEEESKRVGWSHEIAPWIVFFQNVDAIVGPDEPVVYPEHLTDELDYELELAVVIGEAGQVVLARGGCGLHRRLRDLQRHHRARHPAARDALGRLLVLQGDRHLLPAGALDRDARRDPGPARPAHGAARQRRAAPGLALAQHVRDDPGDPVALLAARLLAPATSSRRDGLRRGRASPRTRRRSTSGRAT